MNARTIGRAVHLRRQERHRRGGHHVRDRRELVRGGLRLGDERGDHRGLRRQDEDPAEDLVDRLEPELEPRGDAEVAAASAQGPEQVRVALRVDVPDLAVGRDHLGGQQLVDRQAVLAHEEAHAAAEGDAAQSHRAGVAEPGGDAVARRPPPCTRPAVRPVSAQAVPSLEVELQPLHLRHVDHDSVVHHAVGRGAVAAALHGQRQPALTGRADHAGHVGGVGHLGDHGGPAVVPAGGDRACLVVVGIAGGDHPAGEFELWSGSHGPEPFRRARAGGYG